MPLIAEICNMKFSRQKVKTILKKLHWKEIFAVLFILLAVYFFYNERRELRAIFPAMQHAKGQWVSIAIIVTFFYILFQAGMYVFCLKSVSSKLSWPHATELFLKRNLVSVFLPAGGVSSLAYVPANIRRMNMNKQQVQQGSVLYGFIGILSVVMVAVPVLAYIVIAHASYAAIPVLLVSIALLVILVYGFSAARNQSPFFKRVMRRWPLTEQKIHRFFSFPFKASEFWKAVGFSVLIEIAGIAHLYLAMMAAGANPSLEAATAGYIIATLFLIISPFLRGLGAVELSLTVLLKQYGYSSLQALEITLLFRVFEFWLPLAAGIFAFIAKGKHLFFRLLPPLLIFLLGVVNIFSVLSPPIITRLHLIKEYLPFASIQATNMMVLLVGLTLVVTANYLFKGLRNAWVLALILSVISIFAHIVKALDYEEAIIAVIVTVVLVSTSRQYRLRSNPKFVNIGVLTAAATAFTVLVFGSIAYYFLDVRHFGMDFTRYQSLRYAAEAFILIDLNDLHPITNFGHEFMIFLRVLSFGSWAFLFYCLIRPAIYREETNESQLDKAKLYLEQYGDSPLDYFKVASDKLLFFHDLIDGFIAYRIAAGYAIVLEEPVCAEENKTFLLQEFEKFCRKKAFKPAYYRVDEESLSYFSKRKKQILIGQEAVMDVSTFTLEGKDKKSLRNALNSLSKKGYKVERHYAPLPGVLAQALQQVSDEWLKEFDMEEVVFAQGMFNRKAVRENDVITVSDPDERIVAFLNIIPDYAKDECTYDMIRKTTDAPGGCMDALVIELIRYTNEKRYRYLNFGLVPMSGIEQPSNPAEQMVKFAYEKLKRFRHYQGLRDFKEKYATEWLNKYLVYETDLDLLLLPNALNKVMQP
ncbi:MAG: hypothetical protein JWN76_2666 [Chitinophagaceae bacterium]|nr:hypothetical protein [Chitinophagaceae bacterium]